MEMKVKQARPIEILLVEDNPGDVTLLKEIFKLSQFSINLGVARNGEDAVAYLRKEGFYAYTRKPDLILLDLNLPKKNGLEVLEEIKRDQRFQQIPVLILTGSNQESDRERAARFRASQYLLKPQNLSNLASLLKYLEDAWMKPIHSNLS